MTIDERTTSFSLKKSLIFFFYPGPPAGGERRKSIYFREAEWGK
jgi:hypothetical protein